MSSVQNNFNQHLTDNPIDHVRYERWRGIFYKSAAVVCIFVLGAAMIIGTVALLHYAPVLLPSFLIVSAVIYKYIRGSLILCLQQRGSNAEMRAHICEEMGKEIRQSEESLGSSNVRDLFTDTFGLSWQEEEHGAVLERLRGSGLSLLVGKIMYWHKAELAKVSEIQDIDRQIAHRLTHSSTIDEEVVRLCKKERRVEDDRLRHRISQAYLLYLFEHPEDLRSITHFGVYRGVPYFHVPYFHYLTSQTRDIPLYCCFLSEERASLTPKEIRDNSYVDLKEIIFEGMVDAREG